MAISFRVRRSVYFFVRIADENLYKRLEISGSKKAMRYDVNFMTATRIRLVIAPVRNIYNQ